MTSFRQLEANRANGRKSKGPRTEWGKQQSRSNALRHGLTAETVIRSLESAADYQSLEAELIAEHRPRTTTERQLVLRLASLMWRLKRSTTIETGLFLAEAEVKLPSQPPSWMHDPQWRDQFDDLELTPRSVPLASTRGDAMPFQPDGAHDQAKELGACFIRVGRVGAGTFDLLRRYENGLWRQLVQTIAALHKLRSV